MSVKVDNVNVNLTVYTSFTNVVPGDVIGYTNKDNNFSHIMMVLDVASPSGYDVADNPYWNDGTGVKIIESVYHDTNKCWGVVNTRSIDTLTFNPNTWSIWRER